MIPKRGVKYKTSGNPNLNKGYIGGVAEYVGVSSFLESPVTYRFKLWTLDKRTGTVVNFFWDNAKKRWGMTTSPLNVYIEVIREKKSLKELKKKTAGNFRLKLIK